MSNAGSKGSESVEKGESVKSASKKVSTCISSRGKSAASSTGTNSRDQAMQDQAMLKCKGGPNGQCGQEVKDDDLSIQCDVCDYWYHASCQCVPDEAVEAGASHKSLAFLCSSCKAIARKHHAAQGTVARLWEISSNC